VAVAVRAEEQGRRRQGGSSWSDEACGHRTSRLLLGRQRAHQALGEALRHRGAARARQLGGAGGAPVRRAS